MHVIAAGSHFEATLKRGGFSVPVGRVEHHYLYPLSFDEYLFATGRERLPEQLNEVSWENPPSAVLHAEALNLLGDYIAFGGMPEIVAMVRQGASHQELTPVYEGLLLGYSEDVYKYSSEAEVKYLQFVLRNAPLHVCQQFKFENFAQGGYRSREMAAAFRLLSDVLLMPLIEPTNSTTLPLQEKTRYAKKYLFLDIGLLQYALGVQKPFLGNDMYLGSTAEQLVGQELLAASSLTRMPLMYWKRGSSEVDYCFQCDDQIVGVEVKSGSKGRMRSLFQFCSVVERALAVRLYTGRLLREQLQVGNASFSLKSIPLYLAYRTKELL